MIKLIEVLVKIAMATIIISKLIENRVDSDQTDNPNDDKEQK